MKETPQSEILLSTQERLALLSKVKVILEDEGILVPEQVRQINEKIKALVRLELKNEMTEDSKKDPLYFALSALQDTLSPIEGKIVAKILELSGNAFSTEQRYDAYEFYGAVWDDDYEHFRLKVRISTLNKKLREANFPFRLKKVRKVQEYYWEPAEEFDADYA